MAQTVLRQPDDEHAQVQVAVIDLRGVSLRVVVGC